MVLQHAMANVVLTLLLLSQCCPNCLAVQYQGASASSQNIARHQGLSEAAPTFELADLEARLMAANVMVTRRIVHNSSEHVVPKLHVHIHKAGGTTMCWLAGVAGELTPQGSNCNWPENDLIKMDNTPRKRLDCEARRKAYKSNNWTYGQIERAIFDSDICPDFQYSVLLREPLDLITSVINYEHWKNASTRIGHMRELIAKGITDETKMGYYDTLDGLQPKHGWKFMDNMQIRVLAGAMAVPPGNVTAEHLQIAKHRLAKFHLVAKLEDLADPHKSHLVLAKMGWNMTLDAEQKNSKERKEQDEPSDADKAWLRHLNRLDYELYNSF